MAFPFVAENEWWLILEGFLVILLKIHLDTICQLGNSVHLISHLSVFLTDSLLRQRVHAITQWFYIRKCIQQVC